MKELIKVTFSGRVFSENCQTQLKLYPSQDLTPLVYEELEQVEKGIEFQNVGGME